MEDASNLEDNLRGTGRNLPADIEETDSREPHAPFDYYKYNGHRCRVEVYAGNELRTTLMTDKPSWKEHRGFSYWHSDPKTVDMRGKDISWLRYSNCKKVCCPSLLQLLCDRSLLTSVSAATPGR